MSASLNHGKYSTCHFCQREKCCCKRRAPSFFVHFGKRVAETYDCKEFYYMVAWCFLYVLYVDAYVICEILREGAKYKNIHSL